MDLKEELKRGFKEILDIFKNPKQKSLNEIYNELDRVRRELSQGPDLKSKIEKISDINKEVRKMLDYYVDLKKQVFILQSHLKELKKKEDSIQVNQIESNLRDLLTEINSKIKIKDIIELRVAFDKYYWEAIYNR